MFLHVQTSNTAAKQLYSKQGFQQACILPGYYARQFKQRPATTAHAAAKATEPADSSSSSMWDVRGAVGAAVNKSMDDEHGTPSSTSSTSSSSSYGRYSAASNAEGLHSSKDAELQVLLLSGRSRKFSSSSGSSSSSSSKVGKGNSVFPAAGTEEGFPAFQSAGLPAEASNSSITPAPAGAVEAVALEQWQQRTKDGSSSSSNSDDTTTSSRVSTDESGLKAIAPGWRGGAVQSGDGGQGKQGGQQPEWPDGPPLSEEVAAVDLEKSASSSTALSPGNFSASSSSSKNAKSSSSSSTQSSRMEVARATAAAAESLQDMLQQQLQEREEQEREQQGQQGSGGVVGWIVNVAAGLLFGRRPGVRRQQQAGQQGKVVEVGGEEMLMVRGVDGNVYFLDAEEAAEEERKKKDAAVNANGVTAVQQQQHANELELEPQEDWPQQGEGQAVRTQAAVEQQQQQQQQKPQVVEQQQQMAGLSPAVEQQGLQQEQDQGDNELSLQSTWAGPGVLNSKTCVGKKEAMKGEDVAKASRRGVAPGADTVGGGGHSRDVTISCIAEHGVGACMVGTGCGSLKRGHAPLVTRVLSSSIRRMAQPVQLRTGGGSGMSVRSSRVAARGTPGVP